MKHLHIYILSFILPTLAQHAFSQWFFETGFNESKFNDFTVVGGVPTELNSYEGFHDLSQSLGYLFTFKNRNLRAEKDYTDPLVHLGVGGILGVRIVEKNTTNVLAHGFSSNAYRGAEFDLYAIVVPSTTADYMVQFFSDSSSATIGQSSVLYDIVIPRATITVEKLKD